ncbi:MAG: sucrase ferredoxin, partial [Actinomycetota bacterium]
MSDLEVVADGDDLRCSVLTAALGELPAGSNGSWHRVVLAELPLPWPDDITDHPLLAGVDHDPRQGRRHRVLALASALSPADARPDDGLRVICYWRPLDERAGFRRAEVCAPDEDLGEIVELLLDAPDAELASLPTDGFAAGAPAVEPPVRDLLVCTHGTRDRCCGKRGTNLFRALIDRVPPDTRVWRTSHTGGHRFAPT